MSNATHARMKARGIQQLISIFVRGKNQSAPGPGSQAGLQSSLLRRFGRHAVHRIMVLLCRLILTSSSAPSCPNSVGSSASLFLNSSSFSSFAKRPMDAGRDVRSFSAAFSSVSSLRFPMFAGSCFAWQRLTSSTVSDRRLQSSAGSSLMMCPFNLSTVRETRLNTDAGIADRTANDGGLPSSLISSSDPLLRAATIAVSSGEAPSAGAGAAPAPLLEPAPTELAAEAPDAAAAGPGAATVDARGGAAPVAACVKRAWAIGFGAATTDTRLGIPPLVETVSSSSFVWVALLPPQPIFVKRSRPPTGCLDHPAARN